MKERLRARRRHRADKERRSARVAMLREARAAGRTAPAGEADLAASQASTTASQAPATARFGMGEGSGVAALRRAPGGPAIGRERAPGHDSHERARREGDPHERAPHERDPWAEPWDDEPRPPLRRRLARVLGGLAYALVLVVVIGALGFGLGGFLRYLDEVERFAAPPIADVARADGIVVLTGGPLRLEAAGALLEGGRADQLLVSGVNLRATEPQVRRLLGVSDANFACCVELGFEARDTIGNARETTAWFERLSDEEVGTLGRGEGRSLIVVTSNYHMLRALHELKRSLPDVALTPYAVQGLDLRGDWWRSAANWRLLVSEYGKLFLARMREVPVLGPAVGSVVAPPPAADA